MRYKKAQMEMIGLLIIVFLLSLGMFFLLSTTVRENKKSVEISPQNVNLAQNTIDALKYVKLDCPPNKRIGLDEMIQDMATFNMIRCDYNAFSSSEYSRAAIYTLLNQTLLKWSKSFVFRIKLRETNLINPIRTYYNSSTDMLSLEEIGPPDCDDGDNDLTIPNPGNPGWQGLPLPSNMGTVEMKIHICD